MMATVLLIDDSPDHLGPLQTLLRDHGIAAPARHPQDITLDDLLSAHLILVDLRLEDWQERDAAGAIALQPLNGVGLIPILRGHLAAAGADRPYAFALNTGHPEDLTSFLPPDGRLHAIARTNNLEWVFAKAGQGPIPPAQQIASLARAVEALPRVWSVEDPEGNQTQTTAALALGPDCGWYQAAWEDIDRCHPPIHEMSKETHGIALLRWMLQRILPYPCFVSDLSDLAIRLRVPQASLSRAFAETTLANLFEKVRYTGILADFAGRRWWRAGIEEVLWQITDGQSFSPDAVFQSLLRVAPDLERLPEDDVVACISQDLHSRGSAKPVRECVRVQPDDWPPFADPAWAHIDQLRAEPRIVALVLEEDRPLMQGLLLGRKG
jgi:hypothetical protein